MGMPLSGYRANWTSRLALVMLQSCLGEMSCYRADCKSRLALALLQSHPHDSPSSMKASAMKALQLSPFA